jgi:formylglycine-generating enzyme required for sulfatase activity
LYQVHGNVWEWCEDLEGASSQVLRGGSWYSKPEYLRSDYRVKYHSDHRESHVGFRVARTL